MLFTGLIWSEGEKKNLKVFGKLVSCTIKLIIIVKKKMGQCENFFAQKSLN